MLDTPASSTRNIPWTRIITFGIVVVGTILNILFIVPNGDYSCQGSVCGIRIGEWHYHDALWHIAVARNSFTSFPFVFPSAAGYALTSYNYLLGAIIFILEKVWINPFFTYFKFLPILGNIALVYTLFRYYRLTKKTELEQLWITFFMYLGSSFSFLLILYRNDFTGFSILKGFPVVATLQPAFVLSNVQFFLTLPILIYIFTNIVIRLRTKYTIQVHCLLLFFVVGLKIYSGMFVFLILTVGAVSNLITKKQYWKYLAEIGCYSLTFVLGILLFFLPFSKYTIGAPFAWSPFAIPHAITESPDLFYHKNFTLGRYFMYGLHKLSFRLILYETISTVIFLIWNVGSRVIIFAGIAYSLLHRKLNGEYLFLFTLGLIGMFMPVLFVQEGGGWFNIIQFGYIGIYLLGILAGIYVSKMWKSNHVLLRLLVILTIIVTLPNNVLVFRLLEKEKILITNDEVNALNFLREQPRGVVLSFPDDKNSSYVPALSAKIGYMIDYEVAGLINLPEIQIEQRIDDVEKRKCSILEEVDYLYLNSSKGKEYTLCPIFKSRFKQIYHNSTISISMKK